MPRPRCKPWPPDPSQPASGKPGAVQCVHRACLRRTEKLHGLFIRTVGLARARTKIGLANLVYNVKRLIVLERQAGSMLA